MTSTPRRHYDARTRAEACGLAASVGIREASRRLNVPHRTISHWLRRRTIDRRREREEEEERERRALAARAAAAREGEAASGRRRRRRRGG